MVSPSLSIAGPRLEVCIHGKANSLTYRPITHSPVTLNPSSWKGILTLLLIVHWECVQMKSCGTFWCQWNVAVAKKSTLRSGQLISNPWANLSCGSDTLSSQDCLELHHCYYPNDAIPNVIDMIQIKSKATSRHSIILHKPIGFMDQRNQNITKCQSNSNESCGWWTWYRKNVTCRCCNEWEDIKVIKLVYAWNNIDIWCLIILSIMSSNQGHNNGNAFGAKVSFQIQEQERNGIIWDNGSHCSMPQWED